MYENRRPTLSIVRMVCNAVAASIKGTFAGIMDRVSNPAPYGSRSDAMVHEYTGCQFSDSYGYGIEPGSGRRRRGTWVPVLTYDGPYVSSHQPHWEGKTAILPPYGYQAGECRAEIAGDRHKGRRRVRRSAAKRTPKRKAVPMAYSGICGYPHAYFPDRPSECVGGDCGKFVEVHSETKWVDIGRIKGAK